MDVTLIVAGALLVLWPLQYRWSMRRTHAGIERRGGDVEEFKRRMGEQTWIRAALWIAPIVGVVVIVVGVTGG